MSIETLLSRLEGVKETGHGKYVARCPAHEDRSPSLAIKDDAGVILLKCFAGCETEDVLSAIGLIFGDLYPERPESNYKPSKRRHFDARQILECLSHEMTVVSILAERYADIADEVDAARLRLAAFRINTALAMAPPLQTPPELKAIRRAA